MVLRALAAILAWTGGAFGQHSVLPLQWMPTPWTAVHQWSNLAANITLLDRPDSDASNITARWRILHLTDAHISLGEASDLHASGTRRMHGAFRSRQDQYLERGARRAPAETFERLLKLVRDADPDVVVLGGDIVNFPHNASVQFVLKALAAAGCGAGSSRVPTLFTAGNHDWLVEGLQRSRADQQSHFRREILKPLYCLSSGARGFSSSGGGDYAALELSPRRLLRAARGRGRGSTTISAKPGLRFGPQPGRGLLVLTLDNSRLEVSSEQAAFVWRQLSRGVPTVLVVHVPFLLSGANANPKNNKEVLCGDPRYSHKGDTGWQVERRERWPQAGAPTSTARFVEDLVRVYAAPRGPLLSILAGHEHLHRADTLGRTWAAPPRRLTCIEATDGAQASSSSADGDGGGAPPACEYAASPHVPNVPLHEGLVQYVTPAACEGGHRIVEVRDARAS